MAMIWGSSVNRMIERVLWGEVDIEYTVADVVFLKKNSCNVCARSLARTEKRLYMVTYLLTIQYITAKGIYTQELNTMNYALHNAMDIFDIAYRGICDGT